MKNLILPLLILLFCLGSLLAQDEANFSHYTVNPVLVNPAASGLRGFHQLQVNGRSQWAGITDSPKSINALYNGPLGNKFGLGVGVLSESAGLLSRTKAMVNYSFFFDIKEDFFLSAGFSTEFQQLRLKSSAIFADINKGNKYYDLNDPIAENAVAGIGRFDVALSVMAGFGNPLNSGTNERPTYLGVTFSNIVGNRLDNIAIVDINKSSPFDYYMLLAGHKIKSETSKISVEPSVFLRRIKNAPFQADLNVNVGMLNDQFITGISYRSIGAVGFLLGAKAANIQFYYSFDLSFQEISTYVSGTSTHEVTFAISFDPRKYGNKR
jgi:type IX secretion system PorP/SprF family membrane protein